MFTRFLFSKAGRAMFMTRGFATKDPLNINRTGGSMREGSFSGADYGSRNEQDASGFTGTGTASNLGKFHEDQSMPTSGMDPMQSGKEQLGASMGNQRSNIDRGSVDKDDLSLNRGLDASLGKTSTTNAEMNRNDRDATKQSGYGAFQGTSNIEGKGIPTNLNNEPMGRDNINRKSGFDANLGQQKTSSWNQSEGLDKDRDLSRKAGGMGGNFGKRFSNIYNEQDNITRRANIKTNIEGNELDKERMSQKSGFDAKSRDTYSSNFQNESMNRDNQSPTSGYGASAGNFRGSNVTQNESWKMDKDTMPDKTGFNATQTGNRSGMDQRENARGNAWDQEMDREGVRKGGLGANQGSDKTSVNFQGGSQDQDMSLNRGMDSSINRDNANLGRQSGFNASRGNQSSTMGIDNTSTNRDMDSTQNFGMESNINRDNFNRPSGGFEANLGGQSNNMRSGMNQRTGMDAKFGEQREMDRDNAPRSGMGANRDHLNQDSAAATKAAMDKDRFGENRRDKSDSNVLNEPADKDRVGANLGRQRPGLGRDEGNVRETTERETSTLERGIGGKLGEQNANLERESKNRNKNF